MNTPVKVIRREGESVLVEWFDQKKIYRSILPISEVTGEGDQWFAQDPETGIPYGFNWAEIWGPPPDPELITQLMRNSGIWTLEDAQKNSQKILGVIQAFYGVDLNHFLAAVQLQSKLERSSE